MSPDGRSLALILTEEPQPLDYSMVAHPIAIYILDMKSRTLRLLLEDGGELVWSPDSRRLAYHYGHTLYVTDVATGETTGVYTAEAEYDEAYPRNYSWSPDGRYLALIKEDPFTGRSLLVVDTQGEAAPVTLVSREPYSVGDTQWSPTGNQITYVFPGEGRLGRYDLWITNPDGADKRQLTYDLDVASVQWSADGQWLALYALAAYEPEPANWDLWPVSYTHLDVYKRQLQRQLRLPTAGRLQRRLVEAAHGVDERPAGSAPRLGQHLRPALHRPLDLHLSGHALSLIHI